MALAVVMVTHTCMCPVTSPEGVRGTREELSCLLLALQPVLERVQVLLHPSHVLLNGLGGFLHDPHLRTFRPQRTEEVLGLDEKGGK